MLCHSVRISHSPLLVFTFSLVAREKLATAVPPGVYLISGSRPRLPMSSTRFKLAILPPCGFSRSKETDVCPVGREQSVSRSGCGEGIRRLQGLSRMLSNKKPTPAKPERVNVFVIDCCQRYALQRWAYLRIVFKSHFPYDRSRKA